MKIDENDFAIAVGLLLMALCLALMGNGCAFDAQIDGMYDSTRSIEELTAEVTALRQQMAGMSVGRTGLASVDDDVVE